jgi:hypothetical protein
MSLRKITIGASLGIALMAMPTFAADLRTTATCTPYDNVSEEAAAGPLPDAAFSVIDQMPETATTKCPESLQALKSDFLPDGFSDLCALYTRYHAALDAAKKRGLNPPERIAEILGPRFINFPDWNKAKAKGKADPWTIYNPAPQTWKSWDEARRIADQIAARNLETGKTAPFTLDTIREIHTAGLKNLPHAGDYRSSHNSEIGMSFDRGSTLPFKQVQALQHIEYMNLKDPSKPLISWTPSTCIEEWSEDIKRDVFRSDGVRLEAIPKLADQNSTFASPNGTSMQCGYITYAPTSEVPGQLENWMNQINSTTETWGTDNPQGDPILTAARAQRWFIAVHPFEKGNGRTSRLIMDEILQSQGLPTPIFTDMNDDIGTPEKEWAQKVGQGMLHTIEAIENCARRPSQPGCQVVSSDAPN